MKSFNEFLDAAYPTTDGLPKVAQADAADLAKIAQAEAQNRAAATEIIKQAALAENDQIPDDMLNAQTTEHLVKVANAILAKTEQAKTASAQKEEASLELSPRLQQLFATNPDALAKFAAMDEDHQHMIVCGDLMGETAARSFLAAIQAQSGAQAQGTPGMSLEKQAALDEAASEMAYQHLLATGQLREADKPKVTQIPDDQIIQALAQQKVAAYLAQH